MGLMPYIILYANIVKITAWMVIPKKGGNDFGLYCDTDPFQIILNMLNIC